MLRFALPLLASLAFLAPVFGGSGRAASGFDDIPAAALETLPLDRLYQQLAASPDPAAAAPYEAELLRRYHDSGSDTADLLLSWAMQAIREKSYATALDVLDRVVVLKPDFAEGWNKRATVYYLQRDFGQSIADIEKVLRLEPRHFGALVGLGMIFKDLDDEERAMEAFRRALAVHPHLEGARKTLDEMEKNAKGRRI